MAAGYRGRGVARVRFGRRHDGGGRDRRCPRGRTRVGDVGTRPSHPPDCGRGAERSRPRCCRASSGRHDRDRDRGPRRRRRRARRRLCSPRRAHAVGQLSRCRAACLGVGATGRRRRCRRRGAGGVCFRRRPRRRRARRTGLVIARSPCSRVGSPRAVGASSTFGPRRRERADRVSRVVNAGRSARGPCVVRDLRRPGVCRDRLALEALGAWWMRRIIRAGSVL